MIGKTNVGGENVKAEVEYQTPLLTQILEGLVGKAQGANATADKILEGYSAYVGQERIEGTAKDFKALATMLGYTKMAIDKFTFSTAQGSSHNNTTVTLQHSLGEKPNMAILFGKSVPASQDNYNIFASLISANGHCIHLVRSISGDSGNGAYIGSVTSEKINYEFGTRDYLEAGVEYTLITMA